MSWGLGLVREREVVSLAVATSRLDEERNQKEEESWVRAFRVWGL